MKRFNDDQNPGVNTSWRQRQTLSNVRAGAGINQIRGINVANATGSGIPAHVTNVSSSMANAQAGSTSTVTVTFRRDPSDKAFSGVTILAKGYQGNPAPVQVGSGADSPISFILTNTGEAVSLIVQANGNGGSAPLNTAPTVGINLPKSSSGGVGTTTSTGLTSVVNDTNVTGSISGGALTLGWNGTLSLSRGGTAANLSATGGAHQVVKQSSAGAALTVGTLATSDLSDVTTSTPLDGDVLRYSVSDAAYMRYDLWDWFIRTTGTGEEYFMRYISNLADASGPSNLGTVSAVNPTTSNPMGTKRTTAAVNPSSASVGLPAANILSPLALWRRVRFRIRLAQTTTSRIWIGITDAANNSTAFRSNTPAQNFIGFCYRSNLPDAKYQLVTQTSAVNSTKTAESTASHIDTNTHTFDIVYDGTTAFFYIDDTAVGSQSSNMPSSSTNVAPLITLDNDGSANAVAFELYYVKGGIIRL